MGEITRPDTNPLLLASMNVLFCGLPVGYLALGQPRKAAVALAYQVALLPFAGFLALVWAWDVYWLGQRLAEGGTIGESSNALGLLDRLPGFR